MVCPTVIIRPASDRSLLVCFGEQITLETHAQVASLTRSMEGVRGVLNLHPAFASVLIDFDPRLRSHDDVEGLVREHMAACVETTAASGRMVEIPVRYGGEDGPDLDDVARHTGMTPECVVELHSGADYLVYLVCLSTCFPY